MRPSIATASWTLAVLIIAGLLWFIYVNDSALKKISLQHLIPRPKPFSQNNGVQQVNHSVGLKVVSSTLKPPFSTEQLDDAAKILSVVKQMENKRPLLVTLINNAYLPFTYSWLCNTKNMGIHNQVREVTLSFIEFFFLILM